MFKNLFYSLITKGSVALINLLILVITSRYLGVASRGEITIFILNITIIQLINEIYTGYSLVHFIPRFDLKKIIVHGVFYSLLFCSLSSLIVVFFKKQVPGYDYLGYPVTLLVILNSFNCVIILGKEKLKMYNFLSFTQPILVLLGIVVYIFVLKVFTFRAYVYPLLFSFLIAFSISTITVTRILSEKISSNEFRLKSILVNGSVFQLTSLLHIFINRYSYYLLPQLQNVGLYSSASSFMESLLIIVNAVSPVLLARVANQDNTFKSVEMTLMLSKASFIFSALSVALIFSLPGSFFVFVLGPGFEGIKELMLLYAPGILMLSLSGAISYYFSAIGKPKLLLLCYLAGFLSALVLTPFLIATSGTKGAAYGATFSYFLVTCGICFVFMKTNKLTLKRFFSVREDYTFLKVLIHGK
ncbi:hypothetical protein CNR22_03135 [Sphingobacteriaceae bacterium]|nr:hypothetical protein CNR22_03135 [Sphingobacteriaceae bacterium]